MRYTNDMLRYLYDKTAGRCHICRKPLSLSGYGLFKARGGWEVDHSRARAKGGTDSRRNLYPACIPCNRKKQDGCTRSARRAYGFTRAPISRREMARRRGRNIFGLTSLAAVIGSFVIADVPTSGAVLGGLVGAVLGAVMAVE